MRKFLSLLVGLGIGTTIGAVLITLFTPVSSDELQQILKGHYERALKAGRKASAERRTELEKELQDMREA